MNLKSFTKYLATGEYVPTSDAAPFDLAAHDRRFHPHGFNPETDECLVRRQLNKGDDVDDILAAERDEESVPSYLPKGFHVVRNHSWEDKITYGRDITDEEIEKAWDNESKMLRLSLSGRADEDTKKRRIASWRKSPEEMNATTGCPFLTSPEHERQEEKFAQEKEKDSHALSDVIKSVGGAFHISSPHLIYDDVGGTRGSIREYNRDIPRQDLDALAKGVAKYFGDRLLWIGLGPDGVSFGINGPDFTDEVNSYYNKRRH